MSQILALLFKSLAKMPGTIAPAANIDILLTLLFWKLMSDWSSGKGTRWQSHYHQPDAQILQKRFRTTRINSLSARFGALLAGMVSHDTPDPQLCNAALNVAQHSNVAVDIAKSFRPPIGRTTMLHSICRNFPSR